jgi:hypothetical protein
MTAEEMNEPMLLDPDNDTDTVNNINTNTNIISLQKDILFLLTPKTSIEYAITVIQFLFALSIYCSFYNLENDLLKTHIFGMTIAFVLLLPQGVLTAHRFRTIQNNDLRRVRAIFIHALIQIGGLISFASAFMAIYENKNKNKKEHFTTAHSKFGGMTLVLALTAFSLGAIGFNRTGVARTMKMTLEQVKQTKTQHRNVGNMVVALSFMTITLAFHHPAIAGYVLKYVVTFFYIAMFCLFFFFALHTRGGYVR